LLPSIGVPGAKTADGEPKPAGGRPETKSDEDVPEETPTKKVPVKSEEVANLESAIPEK